jgi:hypothetical protein
MCACGRRARMRSLLVYTKTGGLEGNSGGRILYVALLETCQSCFFKESCQPEGTQPLRGAPLTMSLTKVWSEKTSRMYSRWP